MTLELSLEEGLSLVKLARHAIIDYLEHKRLLSIPNAMDPKFLQKCGDFATLDIIKEGVEDLRGYIEYPTPELSLAENTINNAGSATTRDPRFEPVKKEELNRIVIEVSAPTLPSLIVINDPKDIPKKLRTGRDDLIIEKDWFRGLLLPQVPIERGWDNEDPLSHCCMKAGLPPDSWIFPKTKIYTQAIIFKEKTPDGEIKQVKLSKEN